MSSSAGHARSLRSSTQACAGRTAPPRARRSRDPGGAWPALAPAPWRRSRDGGSFAVNPRDQVRRHVEGKEAEAKQIAQWPQYPAVALVARRRGFGLGVERDQPLPAYAAYQIDILHQRQGAVTADAVVESPFDQK